jgi:hypothetical protein
VTADSAELDALIALSGSVRDRRVLAAVIPVATDTTRPFVVRAAAIAVLINYRDPLQLGRVVRNVLRGNRLDVSVVFMSHAQDREGAQAFSVASRQEVDRVLQEVARTEPDPDTRNVVVAVLRQPWRSRQPDSEGQRRE